MSEPKKSKNGLYAIFAKLGPKFLSVLAKLAKGLKFLKFGLAALTFGSYAAIYTWKFALLVMVSIGFHESGHVWAMKRCGLKTKGFYFLPFLGGVAISEQSYKSYKENVFVSIMGPIWGAALAFACAGLYLITGQTWLAAAAAWMAMINLFNLLPVNPLDGGQMLRSIAFSISKQAGLVILSLSLVASFIIFVYFGFALFSILTIVAALDLFVEYFSFKKYKEWQEDTNFVVDLNTKGLNLPLPIYKGKIYPPVMNTKEIVFTGVKYVGLLGALFYLMFSMQHIPGTDMAISFLK